MFRNVEKTNFKEKVLVNGNDEYFLLFRNIYFLKWNLKNNKVFSRNAFQLPLYYDT
jgi:hypothetical protein